MKKILPLVFLVFCSFLSNAQQAPALKVDNDTTYFNSDISFPFWFKAGQSLQAIQNVKNVSIIEFEVDTLGNMKFSKVISGNLNSATAVPTGKVWKLESIGLSTAYSANNASNIISGIDTSLQSQSGFSTNTLPSVFTSPKIFSTPGTYQWKVPPNVNRICIEVWGGGGAGGNGTTVSPSCGWKGGGGGGGGYGYQCFIVQPLNELSIVVGSGGSGDGGSSIVSNFISAVELLSATGGKKGTSVLTTSSGQNQSGGIGGSSIAYFNLSGKTGRTSTGNNPIGGDSGNIGLGGTMSNINGTSPGGGGAGVIGICPGESHPSTQGGTGGDGQVIIYW
jgi:hypothetical protein